MFHLVVFVALLAAQPYNCGQIVAPRAAQSRGLGGASLLPFSFCALHHAWQKKEAGPIACGNAAAFCGIISIRRRISSHENTIRIHNHAAKFTWQQIL